ncbi:MAG: hypothetical protein YFSK_6120 [Candidatus Yanofskyibacterium parasiticum]|nr:MAG: hypothetical protein YFSK_6120 [Candidatus Yanofskybacteria bacterium]
MNLEELKNELLKDPAFRKEWEKNDVKMDIALMIGEARIKRGITQSQLAKKMRTKQAAISRAESGNYLPGLSFLERMAKALGTELIAPKFAFLENKPKKNQGISFCRSEPILVKDKIKRYKNTRPKSRPRQN